MNARDLMDRDVATVGPDTPLRDVAKTLLHHQISAVPVVDESGAVVGMVSEGDLIGRKKTERETRSEWWLTRLAEGEPLSEEFVSHVQGPLAVAREVMSSPVISVGEETRFDEIANLMAAHRVKRVPVVRDGHLVGIVRRADLLHAIGGGPTAPVPHPAEAPPKAAVPTLNGATVLPAPPAVAEVAISPRDEDLRADDFRDLVAHHEAQIDLDRARLRAEAAELRRRNLRQLVDTHISDGAWKTLVHRAREAAERGEVEYLLMRFPCALCSDGGRAINAPDPDWPRTLQGEAAELYLHWERDLRPRGFHIVARVIDFPNGVPGDFGLYLKWGEPRAV